MSSGDVTRVAWTVWAAMNECVKVNTTADIDKPTVNDSLFAHGAGVAQLMRVQGAPLTCSPASSANASRACHDDSVHH